MRYQELKGEALEKELSLVRAEYDEICKKGLKLDLSRGKPGRDQLNLSMEMMNLTFTEEDLIKEGGVDCRNYGLLFGIPEMQRFWAEITGIPADCIIVGGNSSLNMMYDSVVRSMVYGNKDSECPWCKQEKIKFLCPAPGYDRHFGICQSLGIEMIPVALGKDGPDMDEVERLVLDPTVKGIWCVPKYSNPTGITYSDEVVRRLARMKVGAADFRIYWDNAYIIHDLVEEGDQLLDIFAECEKVGTEDRILYFTSSSKITFPGSGVAMMASSRRNIEFIKPKFGVQTIGPDKLNQLRHLAFLKDLKGTREQMRRHAAIIGTKFDIVLSAFRERLLPTGTCTWTEPRGGYFISLDVMEGTAGRVYALCKDAGVTLTTAGATYPYGIDPRDQNLRIAPTYPSNESVKAAVDVLCVAVKLAALEKLARA